MSSAGQVIGGIVGAVIGYFAGGNVVAGAQIGMAIGGALDQPDRYGPRLTDLRTQVSSYGANIPFEYGTNRHAGTLIWPRILEATEHDNVESAKGGPDQHNYTYTMSFAVLVCEGEISGIRRIWANKKLVYDVSVENEGSTTDPAFGALRIHLGTSDQEVDPLIEATETNTPAYRGYAYVVFEDYDVTELSGRVPQFEFEVLTSADSGDLTATDMGLSGGEMAYDPSTGYVWSVKGVSSTRVDIFVTDLESESLVYNFSHVPSSLAASMGNDIIYNPNYGEMWVKNENGTDVLAINPVTYSVREITGYKWPPPPAGGGFTFSWTGIIHYSPLHSAVVMGDTNITTSVYCGGAGDPETLTGRIVLSGDVFGVKQILALSTGYDAVLSNGRLDICEFNGASSGVVNGNANTDIGSSAFMAADLERDRIVVLNDSSTTLIVYDQNADSFTNHVLTFPSEIMPPTASTSLHRILWHEGNDKYYITGHQAGLNWTLYTVNPNTFEVEAATLYSGPTNFGSLLEIPEKPDYLVYTDSGSGHAWKLPLINRINPNQIVLGDIVEDICIRATLETTDVDVTQLDDLVDGYIVGRQAQARACIEPLQMAYFFDAVESDDKIKFVKRGESVTVTTIPLNERAAREFGQDAPENLSIIRSADLELPYQCDVEYSDIDADHLIGNQYDRRIVKDTKQRVNIQLSIVMGAEKAKQIARVNLYEAWRRQSYKWTTTRKYAYLEPTDLVSLPTDSATYTAKIVSKREQPNGIIEWEGIIEDVEIYSQSGADATPTIYSPQTIFKADLTILRLLDIPILRDEDDDAGYYIAMGGKL